MYAEKQLVDRIYENQLRSTFELFYKKNNIKWTVNRELRLPSGKRIDLIYRNKSNRFFFIVEAKVLAKCSAIYQALEYLYEFYHYVWEKNPVSHYGLTSTRAGFIGLYAQYFTSECLYLCGLLGIPCVQVVPVNKQRTDFRSLVSSRNIKAQLSWAKEHCGVTR